MKKYPGLLLLIVILSISCQKDIPEHDVYIDIETPFKNGSVRIYKNNVIAQDIPLLKDGSRLVTFYAVPENTSFALTTYNNSASRDTGQVIIKWSCNKKEKTDVIPVDTITTSTQSAFTSN